MSTLPPHLGHPAFATKCSTCEMLQQDVRQCAEAKCCWTWARHGHEQRVADDARMKEERGRQCR